MPAAPEGHPVRSCFVSLRGWIASGDPIVNPLADFVVTPRDATKAKLHPLGELAGLFEAGDVLEAVGDSERLELLLRNQLSVDLHRNTPC